MSHNSTINDGKQPIDEKIEIVQKKVKEIELIKGPDLTNEVEKIYSDFKSTKITYMFIGDVNAGKTTMINCFLLHYFDQGCNFLPTFDGENTAYFWIIESSNDESFYISCDEEQEKPCNLNEINTKIKNLNQEQQKILNGLKENIESEKIILIKIPKFPKNIRLIDVPGLSYKNLSEKIKYYFDKAFISLFYVKSLEAAENISENIISLLNILKKKNNDDDENLPILFSIIFTKKDKFFYLDQNKLKYLSNFNEEKNKIEMEKVSHFKKLMETTDNYFRKKEFNICKMYFFNLYLLNLAESQLSKEFHSEYLEEKKIFESLNDDLKPIHKYHKEIFPYIFLKKMDNLITKYHNLTPSKPLLEETLKKKCEIEINENKQYFEDEVKKYFQSILREEKQYQNNLFQIIEDVTEIYKKNQNIFFLGEWEYAQKMLKQIILKFNEFTIKDMENLYISVFHYLKTRIQQIIGSKNFSRIFSSNIDKNLDFPNNNLNYDLDFDIGIWEKYKIYSTVNLYTGIEFFFPVFFLLISVIRMVTKPSDINSLISKLLIKSINSNLSKIITIITDIAGKKFSELNLKIQTSLVPTEDMLEVKNKIKAVLIEINNEAQNIVCFERNEKLFEKINFSQIKTKENEEILTKIKNSFEEENGVN